jgi:hypothetical protein
MTVTVYLRANQNAGLSWNQVDSNFSTLAAQVNANTEAIANITSNAGGSVRPATPLLYQSFFDANLGQPIWCTEISPSVVWVNSAGVTV